MREKGYKSEMEYYLAHREKDWIKKSDVLDVFKKEISITAKKIYDEIADSHIEDNKMSKLLNAIMEYAHEVSSAKELTFSTIREYTKKEEAVQEQYDDCVHTTGKALCGLIIKDKLMIVLFILVIVLLIATIITGILKI